MNYEKEKTKGVDRFTKALIRVRWRERGVRGKKRTELSDRLTGSFCSVFGN